MGHSQNMSESNMISNLTGLCIIEAKEEAGEMTQASKVQVTNKVNNPPTRKGVERNPEEIHTDTGRTRIEPLHQSSG